MIFKIVGMTSNARLHQINRSIDDIADRLAPGPMTVLAVWAHPDDESLLAGGLLAGITRRGGRVVSVTATAGEHGTDDPITEPPAVLARRRVRELDAALAALGAEPAIHLGYGDGTCDLVTDRLAAHLIGRIVDHLGPDAIVTFGPDGVTGHPDHQAVARWVRCAAAARGDRVPLITTAAASAWTHDEIERLHTIDAFRPGYPVRPVSPAPLASMSVRLDDDLLASKLAAIACHESQMGPVTGALGPRRFRRLAANECYVAANAAARHRLSQELTPLAA